MGSRVAINGFGRIGRLVARILANHPELDLVAINDPSDLSTTAHLLQFDSNYGPWEVPVKILDEQNLKIGSKKVRYLSSRNITDLPWGDLGVDIVLECTGVFRTQELCQPHLDQGAKKVLLSAPAKGDGFRTIVLGVNDEDLKADDAFVSNASCTTNCLAPVAKVLDQTFGIESGLMTTVHSYTNDQRILDVGHSDLRRARAAATNIIPTSTGAAKAVGLVLPQLKGKLNGLAIRVPTPVVSLVDLVVSVKNPASAEAVNQALADYAQAHPTILRLESRPLVSQDFVGESCSSVVDGSETLVTDSLVKVLAWYDNEWGYSSRLVELASQL